MANWRPACATIERLSKKTRIFPLHSVQYHQHLLPLPYFLGSSKRREVSVIYDRWKVTKAARRKSLTRTHYQRLWDFYYVYHTVVHWFWFLHTSIDALSFYCYGILTITLHTIAVFQRFIISDWSCLFWNHQTTSFFALSWQKVQRIHEALTVHFQFEAQKRQ
jgi:hypothetical protein